MKKALIYLFASIGVLSILFFSYYLLANRSGSTMYGGSPAPLPTAVGSAPTSASDYREVALQTGQKTQLPSEGVMRRMIIRNANMTLQVNNINRAIDEITKLADNSGGYVVSSDVTQDSNNNSAEISIRVPAEGLNNALTQLKSLANQVVQESISGEDITQQYVDLESQLGNLEQTKTQLEKIMLGATKTGDVLQVFKQISDTQGQMMSLKDK